MLTLNQQAAYAMFRLDLWHQGRMTYQQIDDKFARGELDKEFTAWLAKSREGDQCNSK